MGLDSGTKTGCAVLDDKGTTIDFMTRDFSKLARFDRWITMRAWLGNRLQIFKPKLVVIEGYGYGNPFSLATLAEYGTVLRLTMIDHGVPFVEITPKSLKAFVGGGEFKKDQIRLAVYKKWGVEHTSDDAVDAYLAARFAMALVGWDEVNVKQKQIFQRSEAVKAFFKTCPLPATAV